MTQEVAADKVKIFYEGKEFQISKLANEDQVREAMSADFPEAANARIEQDADTGNWTVTREAGQKGC